MTQITGGTVSFRRVVQPAQYESKEASVNLSFVVDEGSSQEVVHDMLEAVAQTARTKALEMVGLRPAGDSASTSAPVAVKETKPPRTRKAAAETRQISENPEDRQDPLAGAGAGTQKPPEPVQTVGDPDGLDLEPAKDITDKDLSDAVTAWVNKHKNPQKVKDLRSQYVAAGASLRDIPQDKRAEFLAKLEA